MNESITLSLDRFHEIFNLVECIERDHKILFDCRKKDDAYSVEKTSFAMTNMGANIRYTLNYLKGDKLKP